MLVGGMLMAFSISNAYSFMQPLTADEKRIIEWLYEWYAGAPDHTIPYKWVCMHYVPILGHECLLLKEQKNVTDAIIPSLDERLALNLKIIRALLEFQGLTQMEIEEYMQPWD